MKIITKEILTTVELYEAYDGTVFKSKDECTKYEESALSVVESRLKMRKSLPSQCGFFDDFHDCGCRRSEYFTVSLETDDDVKNFKQFLTLKEINFPDPLGSSQYYRDDTKFCPYFLKEELRLGEFIYIENSDCEYYAVTSKDRFIAVVKNALDRLKEES